MHQARLHARLRSDKNAGEVLAFFRQIRMRYDPRLRIYLVMDNLSTHKTPAVREWAPTANVELVFTPTYASFLNRIEGRFWAINEFSSRTPTYPAGTSSPGRWRANPLSKRAEPRSTPRHGGARLLVAA